METFVISCSLVSVYTKDSLLGFPQDLMSRVWMDLRSPGGIQGHD